MVSVGSAVVVGMGVAVAGVEGNGRQAAANSAIARAKTEARRGHDILRKSLTWNDDNLREEMFTTCCKIVRHFILPRYAFISEDDCN